VPTFHNPRSEEYEQPNGFWFKRDLASLVRELPVRSDLICGDHLRLGTRELQVALRRTAGWLRERGIERGSAVGWQLPNGPEVVVLYLATWWLGAAAVPFHEGLTAVEAQRVIDQVGQVQVLLCQRGATLSGLDGATILPAGNFLGAISSVPVEDSVGGAADPAVILTTSGSSGIPKSVIHSQRTLAHKARQLPRLHGTSAADSVLVPAPLSHMAGLLHAVLHPLGTGVKAVIMARWNADQGLALVRDERVTMLFGPPIFALGIASAEGFTPDAVESVRLVSSGGTSITEAYAHHVESLFGAVVKRTYGSTEAPVALTTYPEDDPKKGWATDGRPVSGVELELRDPSDGRVVKQGEVGEIWLRGPELCDGYLDPHQTADAFVDGWMRTRDLATVDEDGFVTVIGRISGLIIRGGMNISAREIESALESHPDVTQAVVLGYPDPVYGERVAAFIVSRSPLTRERCVEWFAQHGVAKYKVPDRIERLDAIPVLATYQKPDLVALRALLSA
jgi:cyclohexanecarboxylate-CoA ligase